MPMYLGGNYKAVAFIIGYLAKDVYLTLWIMLAGAALTALVTVPPWPFYNRHPEKWLGSIGAMAGSTAIIVEGVKGG
jgi:signal peptidase complex subunit 1